jgi:hypothetical protein
MQVELGLERVLPDVTVVHSFEVVYVEHFRVDVLFVAALYRAFVGKVVFEDSGGI